MIYRTRFTLCSILFFLISIHNHAFTQKITYKHQKISAKTGSFEGKLARDDHFGSAISEIGDLNGDGILDIAVGVPGDDDGVENAGAIWILFLDENAHVKAEQKVSMKYGMFSGTLSSEGGFGNAITSLGDLDNDGVPDIAVGESGSDDGGKNQGAVWILFLNKEGTVKSHQKISKNHGGFSGNLCKGFRFGASIATTSDFDGDGIKELAVSTGMNVEAAKGEFWLLFLTEGGQVKEQRLITEGKGEFSEQLMGGDFFGSALCNLGDLNGDGIDELAVGALGDDDGGTDNGAVYILFWNEAGEIDNVQKVSSLLGNFGGKLDNGDHFGVSIASLGDVNGDDIPDMAIGSYHDDDESPDRGAVWVLYLNENGEVKSHHKISETSGNFKGELGVKYEWGKAVAGLRDFNGDGKFDIAISGHKDNDGGSEKGAVWILSPEDKPVRNTNQPDLLVAKSGIQDGISDSSLTDLDFDLTGTPENHILFLLDVSASMKKSDRLPLLRDSFLKLLKYMRPVDKVSVITYSGAPKVVLEAVPAIYKDSIAHSIENLISKGSTKTYKALKQAYKLSNTHFLPNGNNRIILATDGGFEISKLFKLTEKYGRSSLPMSVFYFGKQPKHKKELLEELAQSSYGNCAHILPLKVDAALLRELKSRAVSAHPLQAQD